MKCAWEEYAECLGRKIIEENEWTNDARGYGIT